jgi:hypothetical protein
MHADMLTPAIQHPMCHAKSWRAVDPLFHVFSVEVFLTGFFGKELAVENCARSKRMNRTRHKSFLLVDETSHSNFYGCEPVAIDEKSCAQFFSKDRHKHRTHIKALQIKGEMRPSEFCRRIPFQSPGDEPLNY